jgi:heme/copper-type cytochrome/quinol oxidase subunit 1
MDIQGALEQSRLFLNDISIIGFGFIGGTTGVIFGMEQTNIIVHNTIAIPVL